MAQERPIRARQARKCVNGFIVKIICYCQRPETEVYGPQIFCTSCNRLFHEKCINLSKAQLKRNGYKYYCKWCTNPSSEPKSFDHIKDSCNIKDSKLFYDNRYDNKLCNPTNTKNTENTKNPKQKSNFKPTNYPKVHKRARLSYTNKKQNNKSQEEIYERKQIEFENDMLSTFETVFLE